MFKNLFNYKNHLRFVITPFIRYKLDRLGDIKCVNSLKREVPIIISITSYEERFDDLEIALYSLMNQTTMPDRIILWLSDKYDLANLPYSVTRYIKNGLEIRFVKDIGPYTKNIYALKKFRSAVVVTADDDVYYPEDWLEKLYHSYATHPDDIQVHRAHRVKLKNNHNNIELYPYEKWKKHVSEESARYDNFLTGVGGVLYPPKCFINEVYRDDVFLVSAPFADDVWMWFMALISDRKIRVVKNHISKLTCANILRHFVLKNKSLYSKNKYGRNDEQINALMKYYGQNILLKIENINK